MTWLKWPIGIDKAEANYPLHCGPTPHHSNPNVSGDRSMLLDIDFMALHVPTLSQSHQSSPMKADRMQKLASCHLCEDNVPNINGSRI